ncbi:unnamed protein product [Acanthoscelides obtectus]|uniref:Uncharacterized protein n=1 Tax=Acanthoscelides obtectus TaxID=200917 RepID=A0A9P0M7J9_ACAOB|nr:unnamed protein product [Acanthoscelides obtectus]CAK1645891.1 hypothetical protein AOBTE_LOCUS14319 [Acanthoscelides obtectus]
MFSINKVTVFSYYIHPDSYPASNQGIFDLLLRYHRLDICQHWLMGPHRGRVKTETVGGLEKPPTIRMLRPDSLRFQRGRIQDTRIGSPRL